jgi:hypothetical protein
MRALRPAEAAPCVAATAESLPFEDRSFDAAMAVSTVHHWPDPVAGLREMRRVARRVVVLTYDADDTGWRQRFWLTRDYLPEFADLLVGWPSLADLTRAIGGRAESVLIPWDCADGFFEAYWRRPEAYLDEHVRRAVSVWTRVGPRPNSGQCADSATTFPPAGGPSATANSSLSTPQSSASACSWREFGGQGAAHRVGARRVRGPGPGCPTLVRWRLCSLSMTMPPAGSSCVRC